MFLIIQFNEHSHDTFYRDTNGEWAINLHGALEYDSEEDAKLVLSACSKAADCSYHIHKVIEL
jgi:hypothetical protein